ncbi:substrate-binding periplasmic protein [Elstera cyanobacteriorum]|uniref:substrate-binding periplasmic protein n=1 Tax=Elstera cyanobacteriorum TaxID=2022747 RepID=UPI002353A57C|nr:transporter substrate-binding domain-containing protein [Elstera cyanobacteriorum]MCK6441338.1 transporter substrate-binding domain-containing protein [Elstera cyanobacteriorum]
MGLINLVNTGASPASRRQGGRFLAVFGLLAAIALPVRAQTPLPPLVRLSTGDDYPPFSSTAEAGGGAAVALVKAVFAELKQPIALEIEPWMRGQERLQSQQIDGTFPYVPNPERLALYRYSRPLATIRIRLFTRKGVPLADLPLGAVSGQTLCIARGTSPAVPSARLLLSGQATLVSGSDVATCFKLLLAKRVDLVQTHEHLAKRAMRQLEQPVDAVVPVGGDDPRAFEETGLHFIVSRHAPQGEALIAAFDRGLAALRENGQFAEILSRYGLTLPSS